MVLFIFLILFVIFLELILNKYIIYEGVILDKELKSFFGEYDI